MSDVFVRNYTPLNDDQKRDMDWIKHKAEELLIAMETPIYADKRLQAIAKTQLEGAVMFAVKAVTNPSMPKPIPNCESTSGN